MQNLKDVYIMTKALFILNNLLKNIYFLIEYFFLKIKKLREKLPSEKERTLNKKLIYYPKNHCYRVRNKKLYPNFKLFERFKEIERFIPKDNESFLDIGSCKGFYNFKAAERQNCRVSLGLDVNKPFINLSEEVNNYLKYNNTFFKCASISDLRNNLKNWGGPFQTVLLVGTYHYLFWGSGYCSEAYYSHDKILSILSEVCSEQIIFSGRLDVFNLPRDLKKMARENPYLKYSEEDFLKSAEKYFDVKQVGKFSKYSLYLMKKK